MALYRQINFNTGTLLDDFGAVVSANTGTFSQQTKGLALETNSSKYTTYGSSLLPSGSFTVVVWAKLRDSHLTTDRAQVISTNTVVGAGSIALQYGSYPLLYLGGSNYTYFVYPIPGNKDWHCWVFTIPGAAQTDINSAQCFVDNVSYAQTGAVTTGGQSARTGYVYAGGSATQTGGCMISKIKVYDTVLSRAEIDDEYADFLNSYPINKPKRGFIMPNKPTNLSPEVRNTISSTDSLSGWTFSSGWVAVGATVINSATTFTTLVTSGIYKSAQIGIVGDVYNIRIKGTTTASNLNISDAGGSNYFSIGATGAFDVTRQITWTGDRQLFLQNTGAGVTTIDILTLNKVTGLVAAYNMIKNGSTLVDISGNGYKGTIGNYITSTLKGLSGIGGSGTANAVALSPAIPAFGIGDYSVSFRAKFISTGNDNGLFGSLNSLVVYRSNASGLIVVGKNAITDISTSVNVPLNTWVTVTLTRTGSTGTSYLNGVFVANYTENSDHTATIGYLLSRGFGTSAFGGEIQDLRFHNRVLSTNEIVAYHNQFVQPTLIDDFSDAGADGITKTDAPVREWERVTGTWKVGENVVSNTQMVVGGPSFSTNVGWSLSGGNTISGGVYTGIAPGLNYCTSLLTLTAGKRYRVEVNILTDTAGTAKVYVGGKNSSVLPVGRTIYYVVMDSVSNQLVGFNDLIGTSNYLSITESPQLETMTGGTKYLECASAGTIAIPSNIAYGTWEWDMYKPSTQSNFYFMTSDTAGNNSYSIITFSTGVLRLYRASTLMSSNTSYISLNTWYRIRITRTTAGSFTILIKGGAFTPTAGYDGWTLVSVSGGSGTNPVTDTTNTTSSFFVMGLGTGDRVANIIIKDGIKG